jgi:antitoxin component YwqK of YwqJK toxin-antitoxin module
MNNLDNKKINITELHYHENPNGSETLCTSNDVPFTGTVYETLPSGSITAEFEVKEGLKYGIEKDYYSEGVIERIAHYREGQLHGDVIYYYPNGIQKEKSVFEYDICTEEFEWDENGVLIHHEVLELEQFQRTMLARLRQQERW